MLPRQDLPKAREEQMEQQQEDSALPTDYIPSASILSPVSDAYERGHIPEALRRAEAFAPLRLWQGSGACALASRIAAHTGGSLLSTRLALRALKADPTDPLAIEQYGYEVSHRRGWLAVWSFLSSYKLESPPLADSHELLTLRAHAALDLRDFAAAEAFIERAESLQPGRAWTRLQRAFLLERLDRLEEALEVAEAACELHPFPYYRSGIQARARLLQLLNRDDDAIRLLHEAGGVLRSGAIAAQLYSLLSENERWAEAETALLQFASLSPLMEKRLASWLTAQQARVAYRLGKRQIAADLASKADNDFAKRFAQRLLEPPPADELVKLDVSFVRQHFKTCAPATLAAIGAFWKMPADHVRVAEAICYDGTPAWQQRDWAAHNGWYVREFRVTRESALELLARRLPFAITTVDATTAHMMAVIGFDRTRDVLLLRDPSQPYVIEGDIGAFFERYSPFGPRGMLFIPEAERHRVNGIDLPDAALYDQYHRFSLALARHDREGAARELESLVAQDTHAAITWEARLDLAYHDENGIEQIRCTEKLLEMFPRNPARLLRKLDCMQHSAREDRIRFLEEPCGDLKADPALLIALARALSGDARRTEEASRCVKRALRLRPGDSGAIKARADLLWERGQLDEAVEWYRFAALSEEFREHLWQHWFLACRQTRRTQHALEHLQDRFTRFGHRSEQPALTLAWAWNEVDQPHKARAVLDEAIRLRPEDGQLRLRAAGIIASLGEVQEAERLLDSARGKVRENEWLRARMDVAEKSLDYERVQVIAKELLQKEPLALDAYQAIARVVARHHGIAAARKVVEDACSEYPHHCGLRRMLLEWSRRSEPELTIAAAEELLRLEPSDAVARRELAAGLLALGRHDEALEQAQEARRIEPKNSYSASTLAVIYLRRGQMSEARKELRHAISLSVDNDYAVGALLELTRTDEERKSDVAFIEQELLRQVVTGEGLIAYADVARPILEAERLLALLKQAHAERPDLISSWAALVSQLLHMSRLDEALHISTSATERFPHIPRAWLDLATVHQRRAEPSEEIRALERACEVNPQFASAAMSLAAAYERAGRLADARATYERALRHSSFDAALHAAHASLLWRLQAVDDAFAAIERSLRIAPGFRQAWDDLCDWCAQAGKPDHAVEFARALAKEHSGNPRVWMMLAGALPPSASPERLAAAERAIELDRQLTEAWDLKAQLLAFDTQFDAAAAVCDQGMSICLTDVHILAGRKAWIEAQRRRVPEAVRQMRDVLAGNKGYGWGWYQLINWLLESDDTAGAVEALNTMKELWPHDTNVKRQLAFIYLQQKETSAARAEFEKCLELQPTDVRTAHNLLSLQLDASDLEGASRTLEIMQVHQPGAPTLAAEIDVRLRKDDVSGALDVYARLCCSPDPGIWPIDDATSSFIRALKTRQAIHVVRKALKSPEANPQAGVAVVQLMAARAEVRRAVRFFLSLGPGELRRRASSHVVRAVAENKRRWLLRWLMWRRGDLLQEDVRPAAAGAGTHTRELSRDRTLAPAAALRRAPRSAGSAFPGMASAERDPRCAPDVQACREGLRTRRGRAPGLVLVQAKAVLAVGGSGAGRRLRPFHRCQWRHGASFSGTRTDHRNPRRIAGTVVALDACVLGYMAASALWLAQQPRFAWSFEIEVRPLGEK